MSKAREDVHQYTVTVAGIEADVTLKDIKNLHLSVHPPTGHIRISAPLHTDEEVIRLAVLSRLRWIKKQQAKQQDQRRQSKRKFVSGESHYFAGQRYLLKVLILSGEDEKKREGVYLKNNQTIELRVRADSNQKKRERLMQNWYRKELNEQLNTLVAKWEPKIGVSNVTWGIKRMKTRWGSCNAATKKIWINLELAKKPQVCLDYVVAHEMVHILEQRHNDNFKALMTQAMPQWRSNRDLLNQAPLDDL